MTTPFNLPSWPPGVAMPPRLVELLTFLSAPGAPALFGDFQLDGMTEDAFVGFTGGGVDAPIFREFADRFGFFAKDGSGGELAVWFRSNDPRDWPVVWFQSEARIVEVVGRNVEDFMCLLAGRWEEGEGSFLDVKDERFKAWVRQLGLCPHEESWAYVESLASCTREFWRWFIDTRRTIEARMYPERAFVFDIVPGERMGEVRLGAHEDEVNALLGVPRFSGLESSPTVWADYPGAPMTVTYDCASRTVVKLSAYARTVSAQLMLNGFPLFLASAEDATECLWKLGVSFAADRSSIDAPSVGLELGLTSGHRRFNAPSPSLLRWVDGVHLFAKTHDGE